MITAAQLRAARGLLDWTRSDLAKAAKISAETVKNIEHGTFRPQETTAEAIVQAFAMHDVKFTENEGVQKSKDLVKTFSGESGFEGFLEDIYTTMKDKPSTTYQCNFSDDLFVQYTGDYAKNHIERMSKLSGARVKCLTRQNDYNFVSSTYCEYKWLPKNYDHTVPYYLYNDNVALLVLKQEKNISFVVVQSALLAETYRQNFEQLWQESIVPPAQANVRKKT